jgi:DNA polymerase-1
MAQDVSPSSRRCTAPLVHVIPAEDVAEKISPPSSVGGYEERHSPLATRHSACFFARTMKLLLVDGPYYVYRSFFAIQKLTNSRGVPVNAIYGFVKTIRKMLKDVKPDLAAVLWDQGLPKRRTELQPDYKSTRAEQPEEMRPQFPIIRDIVPLMGLASIGVPDTEADDLMASYATAALARGDEVVLATNDKDLYQLVNAKCLVYSTNKTDFADAKDGFALLGDEKVQQKWGVPPLRIGDVLAIIGDTVDNIPGIAGLGPKTAATLINEAGSLDALLANLDAVKSERTREKLREGMARLRENREMVRLDDDLPLPTPLAELQITPRWPELIAALEKCDFKGLLAEVKAEAAALALPPSPQVPALPPVHAQGELF